VWAVKQSGFDPSQPQLPPHERVEVVAMGPPPGTHTVAGAATGAIIGAAVSRPRDAGGGALVGAVAGAILGASADAANQQRTEAIQRRYDQRDLRAQARQELQARDFRRAISACLEGRGYTVK
jgi:outer membrane lipoprotein SlyB